MGCFDCMFPLFVRTNVYASIKLTRLLRYTTGPAKMAINNCALIGGDAGYVQAHDILKNRYGNSHLVSQIIISDLTRREGTSVVKQQLANELSTAVTALGQLGKCAELNTQQSIIDILQRCQPYVRNRTGKEGKQIKRDITIAIVFISGIYAVCHTPINTFGLFVYHGCLQEKHKDR